MAKLSRRAVASSSSSSSTSSASSSSGSASTSGAAASSNSIAAASTKPVRSGKHAEGNAGGSDAGDSTALPADPLRGGGGGGGGGGASPFQLYSTATTTQRPRERLPNTAQPTIIDSDGGVGSLASAPPYAANKTAQQLLYDERDRVRAEFFATYDVMTGVRIAATLSGFFGLMVFLIVWKSRNSSNETLKVLKDPKMAAVAAVCMQEEEEREIQEAMNATGLSIYPDEYDTIVYRRQRLMSLGNVSAPPMLNRGYRFSSVGGGGGYSSLLEPPRRFSYSAVSGCSSYMAGGRRKSGSESSRILSNYPMGGSFNADDYFIESEDEMENGAVGGQPLDDEPDVSHRRSGSTRSQPGFLEVPHMGQDSRRSSAMTCCSTDSSYLERRCSAFTLGLGQLPSSLQRKLSSASRTSSTENWDYYYPDIQVIQPTPKPTPRPSPCPSERSIYEQLQLQSRQGAGATAAATTTQAQPAATTTTTTTAAARATTTLYKTANKATTTGTATATATATGTGTTTAANGEGACRERLGVAGVGVGVGAAAGDVGEAPTFVRKHSIAYYDPESAQAGRRQQIHSMSADTVDMYPYNQELGQMTPPTAAALRNVPFAAYAETTLTDERRLGARRKVAVMELQRLPYADQMTPPPLPPAANEHNNNNNNNHNNGNGRGALPTSNSLSMDSPPLSIDKLNGSGSLGTVSVKALFNAERRAPLASLSSFKISSLEYQDSEMRSLDDDSVFMDSVADTDEDMQQLSSDSEELSLDGGGEHEARFTRADTVIAAQSRAIGDEEATATATTAQAPKVGCSAAGQRAARRPLLQHHRTISNSSSDRVSLIGQPLREFGMTATAPGTASLMPLETHFGSVICTSSPPMHPRRAQLLQQYSDPQSMPTTTTTTTTTSTTTDGETCSTLNTEVGGCAEHGAEAGDVVWDGASSVGGGSTTQTQHSSLNTIVSFGRSSPQTDKNGVGAATAQLELHEQQQLPSARRAAADDEPCASTISDSAVAAAQTATTTMTRQPLISLPATLKSLIERGGTGGSPAPSQPTVSRSASNLSQPSMSSPEDRLPHLPRPVVMLELPLIKLPTEESSADSASGSDEMDDDDDDDEGNNERSRTRSDESRDPSIPGTSRKWSKETLF